MLAPKTSTYVEESENEIPVLRNMTALVQWQSSKFQGIKKGASSNSIICQFRKC